MLLAAALSSGCSQWHYDMGRPLDPGAVADSAGGVSLGRALDLLGPPHHLSSDANGYVLAWEYWQVQDSSLGISLGLLGVDLFSVDLARARAQGEYLLLTFDRGRQLTARAYGTFDSDTGDGTAVQPFLSPLELVDVDDLVARMPQHRWGATSMQRLPSALNATYSPTSGRGGVEQRGTPSGIGQRALEMQ